MICISQDLIAFLQSSDLGTLFVGKSYEIKMFPFSFSEYQEYYGALNSYELLSKYLIEGGMAGSYVYKTSDRKYNYLNKQVLNTLVVRDIVQKKKIRNEHLLMMHILKF